MKEDKIKVSETDNNSSKLSRKEFLARGAKVIVVSTVFSMVGPSHTLAQEPQPCSNASFQCDPELGIEDKGNETPQPCDGTLWWWWTTCQATGIYDPEP
jgi:hypothetical protein